MAIKKHKKKRHGFNKFIHSKGLKKVLKGAGKLGKGALKETGKAVKGVGKTTRGLVQDVGGGIRGVGEGAGGLLETLSSPLGLAAMAGVAFLLLSN